MNRILFEDKISAIVGGGCSGVVLATMDLVKQAQIPFVVAIATNAAITEKAGVGGNEWVFRVNLTDANFAGVGGPLLVNKLGYHKFSALVRDDDFGRGALNNFKASITGTGGEIVSEDFFKTEDRDFLPTLTKIKNLKPDSLLIAMNSDEALRMLQQYKELGLNIPISGRAPIFTEDAKNQIGFATLEKSSSLDPWFVFDPRPISQDFVQRYKEANGYEPIWQTVLTYESMMVVADAITHAGSDDPKAIRDAIAKTDLADTILGRIKFNDHNQNLGTVHMAQIVDGKLVEVGSGNVEK